MSDTDASRRGEPTGAVNERTNLPVPIPRPSDVARDNGATITMEPREDHGMRFYRATDLEGHRWLFAKELSEANAS